MAGKALVYFVDARAREESDALSEKLKRLFDASGTERIISEGDLVLIKTHFGERGNERYIRPIHIRTIVEKVREAGGNPIVADTTGIGLAAPRGTAHKYLKIAAEHGFTPEVLGAPVVIADDPKGLYGVKLKVDGLRFKEVTIAQAVTEADALISLAHFKGHPRTGFGGALKNIGVGCLTKCGRAPVHLKKKPWIKIESCNNCGDCLVFCPVGAIQMVDGKPRINQNSCVWGCGCWDICPQKAISTWLEMHHPTNDEIGVRAADATAAIVEHLGKNKVGFFNFLYDITPHCDCFPYSDVPMVPDIGILFSFDPVAIDIASCDLVIEAPGIVGSAAEDVNALEKGKDKFSALIDWPPFKIFKSTGGPMWKAQIQAGVKLKLGIEEYEFRRVK